MNEKPNCLILAFDINGLGAVRSLAQEAINVIVICPDFCDPSYHSKHPIKKVVFKYDENFDRDLLDILFDLGRDGDVLMATSDKTVEFIDRNRDSLQAKYRLTVPSSEVIKTLLDKKYETLAVSDIGISCPKTITNIAEFSSDIANEIELNIRWPLILKPRMYKDCRIIKKKNLIIQSREEFIKFANSYVEYLDRFLMQEIIIGSDSEQWVCNCVFDKNSELVSIFTFRRLFLSPAHYGVTSMALSEINDEVIDQVIKLGRALKYIGPAMIEFKYDVEKCKYMYIELNPRLGMCNYFDTSCGINNALASYSVATERKVSGSDIKQKEGIYFISLFDDLYSRRKDNQSLRSILLLYIKLLFSKKTCAYLKLNDLYPYIFRVKENIQSVLSGNKS